MLVDISKVVVACDDYLPVAYITAYLMSDVWVLQQL